MCFSINGLGSPIGNLIIVFISSLQCKSQTDVLHISLLYKSATSDCVWTTSCNNAFSLSIQIHSTQLRHTHTGLWFGQDMLLWNAKPFHNILSLQSESNVHILDQHTTEASTHIQSVKWTSQQVDKQVLIVLCALQY